MIYHERSRCKIHFLIWKKSQCDLCCPYFQATMLTAVITTIPFYIHTHLWQLLLRLISTSLFLHAASACLWWGEKQVSCRQKTMWSPLQPFFPSASSGHLPVHEEAHTTLIFPLYHNLWPTSVVVFPYPFHLTSASLTMSHRYHCSWWVSCCTLT